MMDKLVKAHDFTWAMCQVFIWSCVEPFIGIVCACLPTYAPLVRRWYGTIQSSHSKTPIHDSESRSRSKMQEWNRLHEHNGIELDSTTKSAVGMESEIMVTTDFTVRRS